MIKNAKLIFKSLFCSTNKLVAGLELKGAAKDHIEDGHYFGDSKWLKSYNSYKVVVDKVIGNHIYYYSYMVDKDGFSFIQGSSKITTKAELLRRIRSLDLLLK